MQYQSEELLGDPVGRPSVSRGPEVPADSTVASGQTGRGVGHRGVQGGAPVPVENMDSVHRGSGELQTVACRAAPNSWKKGASTGTWWRSGRG